MGLPFVPVGQVVHAVPQAVASSSFAQAAPHLWAPVAQVNPHVVPSQVASTAFAGTAQGVHEVPQEFTS